MHDRCPFQYTHIFQTSNDVWDCLNWPTIDTSEHKKEILSNSNTNSFELLMSPFHSCLRIFYIWNLNLSQKNRSWQKHTDTNSLDAPTTAAYCRSMKCTLKETYEKHCWYRYIAQKSYIIALSGSIYHPMEFKWF